MEYLIAILSLVAIILWLAAEFRPSRWPRIGFGLAALVGVGIITHLASSIIPRYESDFHRVGLRELGDLAARGDFARVQQALVAYNETAGRHGSTYIAAMKLSQVAHANADQSKQQ
jgi:hypothetical protein